MSNPPKNLYVDDVRKLPSIYNPAEWDIARNYNEAMNLLETNQYHIVSLDHDIASYSATGREMTGYDIAMNLALMKEDGLYVPPIIYCHSANPVGHKNIMAIVERYLTN